MKQGVKWRSVPARDVEVGSTVGHVVHVGARRMEWCECQVIRTRPHNGKVALDTTCLKTLLYEPSSLVRHIPAARS